MPLEQKYLDLISHAVLCAKNDEILSRLSQLYDRVVDTNDRINITSLTSPIDVTLKHIIDSLALYLDPDFKVLADNPKNHFCDVGCGGGFPGLPIASVSPNLPITMIDSTEKKIVALKENAEILSLSQVTPLWGRGEELAGVKGKHRERYDVCVSRAVAAMPVLTELCLPFVKKGGVFYAMKGQKALEELADSKSAIAQLGGALLEAKEIVFDFSSFDLSSFTEEEKEKIRTFSESKRYLLIVQKKKETRPEFPRKWSQMVKKPL